ncbi:MAG TPA: MMPL family transporter [Acidimicrobiia bacterium]|nr:MMPL family transporter [Acidimicrobiia bacterium]
MTAITQFFAAAVRRFPWAVVITSVVVAGALSPFASQVVVATGNEGFAPDNAEIAALDRISELFGTEQEAILQVIIRDPGGDVISASGLEAAMAVEEAIRRIGGGALAESEQRPGVVSFLAPVAQAASEQGLVLTQLDDAAVDELYQRALSQMPPEQAGFVTGLLSEAGDPGSASSPAAIMLAFFRGGEGDATAVLDAQMDLEQSIATELETIETDVEIRPFSFNLLFGEADSFTSEVGRLFSFAGIIIVGILLFVYWVKPRGSANVSRNVRRTLADMGLTMVTIFMAIGMMQGAGVLLEKAGILSAFSAPTQIVPILIIGLGVDYAIHLISRYREEVGEGETVDEGMTRSISTSGVALVLATLTTVIGFLTNLVSPVPALTDFGILAALGIFFSFLLMMTFVPAVRVLLDRRAERRGRLPVEALGQHGERILPQMMGKTAVIAERLPVVALTIALVLGGLGWVGFTRLETRFSFTDFLPEDSPAIATLDILTTEFGGGFGEQTQVLIEAPPAGTLASSDFHNLMVDSLTGLASVASVSTFETPAGPVANANSPVGILQQMVAAGPEATPPDVLAAVASAGLGDDLRAPAGGDTESLYSALAAAAPEQMAAVTHYDGDRLDAVLFDIRTTAGEMEVRQLRDDLSSAFAGFDSAGASVIATSQNIISDVVVNALTASQSSSLFLTLAAATVVLIIFFGIRNRRPFLGVITMAPVALVVLWTYGVMYVAGIPFGPITATLSALAIGIGVPFTIHLARRFEEDRLALDDVEEAIRSTTTHTGGALAGSAFTTMAGFGILMTSSLVPFKQMGQVTFFAIGLSLIAAIGVLPSMLVLWERWHRRRSPADRR